MKHFRHYLRTILILFAVLTSEYARCETADLTFNDISSVKISLLTCGPGNETYSMFGHTAIRVVQPKYDMDIVVNYGMFSFNQPYFIIRFILGLTDYRMGIVSFSDFQNEYRYEDRWVMEQDLNLTDKEKTAILNAINENYKPENVTYRYNYFYNNCTTKARDILTNSIEGSIYYKGAANYPSFRDLCHSKIQENRWLQFGIDLLLGMKADVKTNISEQQFLPERLSVDFDKAQIRRNDGSTAKLIAEEHYILPKPAKTTPSKDAITPIEVLATISLLIIIFSIIEYKKKKVFWQLDTFIMTATGLAGIILFVMIFSQHPTVSVNLQILILNPIGIAMIVPTIIKERKQKLTAWHKIYTICLIIGILGAIVQKYAEGIEILALSLLLREIIISFIINKHQATHI